MVKSYKYQVALLIAALLLIVFTFLPYLADQATFASLFGEQGVFATLTVGYIFVAAVVFLVSFLRFRNKSWLLRLSYLALSLFLLYVTANAVNQFIPLDVNQYVEKLDTATGFGIPVSGALNSTQIVAKYNYSEFLPIFVLAFVLAVPLIAKIIPRAGKLLDSVLPVMPLGAGVLALVAYLVERGSEFFPLPDQLASLTNVQVHELSTYAYSFALVVATIFYFMTKSDEKKKEDDEALLRQLTYYRR